MNDLLKLPAVEQTKLIIILLLRTPNSRLQSPKSRVHVPGTNPGNFVLFAGLGSVISGIEVTKFYAWQLVLSVVQNAGGTRTSRVTLQIQVEEMVDGGFVPASSSPSSSITVRCLKSPATLAR